MEKQYNLGIVGFGGMAGYHYSELKKFDLRITPYSVFDVNEERMQAAREKGMKTYASFDEMLNDPAVDMVLVSATNEVHKELSIAAMRAGKHVICEKPVTISSAQLEEIMRVRDETGMVFTIDQNRRVNPDFVLMRQCVEKGLIGKPYVIESRVEGSRGMPRGWRTIKQLGGGMMLDWGVHLIDQLMYMINEKVVSVYCKLYSIEYKEVDDNFTLLLTFANGLTGVIEVGTNNYITHPRWYVLGEAGTLQINDWDCNGEIVRCVEKESEWEPEIVYTKAGPTKTMAPRRPESVEHIPLSSSEEIERDNNLGTVYRQFVAAIEKTAPLAITAEQPMRVMQVMEAAFESDARGIAVQTNI